MLQKLIHRVSRHHHPWRKMKFDELAEIYTSMSLRSFAFSLIGIFVPVYLYTNGVDLRGIFLFFAIFFGLRMPLSFLIGKLIARIGPKHTIAVSNITNIAFLAQLLSYDTVGWPLGFMALMYTLSNGMFFLAYHTDFSKVQHKKHGGKELGWLYIFERLGAGLGPVVGGLIANYVAPEATIALAIVVFIGSLVPLFLTSEPVKTHQNISYAKFRSRDHARDFAALSSLNILNVGHRALWPLLVAVFIFTEDTYAKLGLIVGVSMAVSMFAARMFGKFIDDKRGEYLLRYGVVMNALLLGSYPFLSTGGGAFVATSMGEPVKLSLQMPLVKGFYDQADSIEGYRIVYLVWAEFWAAVVKTVFMIGLLIAAHVYDPVSVLRNQFFVVAIIGFAILLQQYPALKKQK